MQRPVNAVKELIENSLDAGADRISVHVQVPSKASSPETSPALFSLQVTDNGSGISKDDLELLCERHATSKLVDASDLRTVGTFGFRGEALASCSQVARVEIVTRSREESEEVAWKASYTAGKLTGEPTAIAGNYGTTINVKDLFYGNRVRREALLNSSEEYQKIVQVIQAYALNQAGKCAFSLSRRRDRVEIQTSTGDTHVSIVKSLWNEEIGEALLPFQIESDPKLGIEEGSGGWATRTTFHKLKSPQVIIFLNGRLIDHAVLRRALLQSFSLHLPTSPPAHPFIYLNLRIKGSHVDVNVHPSKRQVFFLDEAEIVKRTVESIDAAVLQRQYETQTLKPIVISARTPPEPTVFEPTAAKKTKIAPVQKISSLYPSQRVLTDSRNHRIDAFLFHSSSQPQATGWSPLSRSNSKEKGKEKEREKENSEIVKACGNPSTSSPLIPLKSSESSQDSLNNSILLDSSQTAASQVSEISVKLETSQQESQQESEQEPTVKTSHPSQSRQSQVESEPTSQSQSDSPSGISSLISTHANAQISKLLQSSLVVGLIDSHWSLLQSGTNLLLCDMPRLNYDLFFSLLATTSKCDKREFEINLTVREVFEEAEIGREAEEVLRGQVGYFSAGFGIKFTESADGSLKLSSLPIILAGQRCPTLESLKIFIHRLALLPDYSAQRILSELAQLYSLVDCTAWADWEDYVKHVVLAAYRDTRAHFTMRNEFRFNEVENSLSSSVSPPVQIITDTETLYKSFERC